MVKLWTMLCLYILSRKKEVKKAAEESKKKATTKGETEKDAEGGRRWRSRVGGHFASGIHVSFLFHEKNILAHVFLYLSIHVSKG